MSYLRYLCLFAYVGVQCILCCDFALFVFVLCILFCFICLRLVYPILLCLSSSCVPYFALFVFVLCILFCFVCLRLVYPILLCLSSSCVSYFVLFVIVLCILFCQFLWIVPSVLSNMYWLFWHQKKIGLYISNMC